MEWWGSEGWIRVIRMEGDRLEGLCTERVKSWTMVVAKGMDLEQGWMPERNIHMGTEFPLGSHSGLSKSPKIGDYSGRNSGYHRVWYRYIGCHHSGRNCDITVGGTLVVTVERIVSGHHSGGLCHSGAKWSLVE